MYKAHIRKALGTFQELQKPGKPQHSQPGEGHYRSSQVQGWAKERPFSVLAWSLVCLVLCTSVLYFSAVRASGAHLRLARLPYALSGSPAPPVLFPCCPTFLLPGTFEQSFLVDQKREPLESLSEERHPFLSSPSHTHTHPHLRSSPEALEQAVGAARSPQEGASQSLPSTLAPCHGNLLISCLAGASDRWPLSESASGVGKRVPNEAGFLVSQLRKTIFQKTEVPLRPSQT